MHENQTAGLDGGVREGALGLGGPPSRPGFLGPWAWAPGPVTPHGLSPEGLQGRHCFRKGVRHPLCAPPAR